MLDGDETQWRRYNPLFEDLSRDTVSAPEAIAAALVETLVILNTHQSLKKPGGFFTKKCRAYCVMIPAHIREMIHTYEHMNYEQLIAHLKIVATKHRHQSFSQGRTNRHRGNVHAPYNLSTRDTSHSTLIDIRSSGDEHNLEQEQMSELEAKSLSDQIKRDATFVEIQDVRQILSTVYVLDVSIDGVPWTITSKQEWDRYYKALLDCESYASQVTEREQTYAYRIRAK